MLGTPKKSALLGLHHSQKLVRIIFESGENGVETAPAAQMLRHDLAEHTAIVRRDRKVAAIMQLALAQSRPARINLSAFDVATHQEHAIRMAVIGPAIAVLLCGSSELGHADEHNIAHAVAHILMERRDSLPQIAQQIRELTLDAALVDVMAPPAAIQKRHFKSHVRFEKLGDFFEAFAETARRILCTVFWLISIGINFLKLVNGRESFLSNASERLVNRGCVHRFKTALDSLLRPVHFELLEIRDRDGRCKTCERARKIWPERDCSKRRRLLFRSGLQWAVQPAVVGGFNSGRTRLHEVLGIE